MRWLCVTCVVALWGCKIPARGSDAGALLPTDAGRSTAPCTLAIEPVVGTTNDHFTVSTASEGTDCALTLDGRGAGIPCVTSATPLVSEGPMALGSHTVAFSIRASPSGQATCLADFTVVSPDTTTCAIRVGSNRLGMTHSFTPRFTSNGTACTWAVDGVGRGSVACNGSGPALPGPDWGGPGSHVLTLNVEQGPGGPTACNEVLTVDSPSATSCSVTMNPSLATETSRFALNVNTNGSDCSLLIDGVDWGTIPCVLNGHDIAAVDLAGLGAHTIVLKVNQGPSGPETCSVSASVAAPNTTTCQVAVDPSSGTGQLPFTIRTTGNGSDCWWTVDGVPKGAIACHHGALSVSAATLGGTGAHAIGLLVRSGPGGPTECLTGVNVRPPASTTCGIDISPANGLPTTTFSLSTSTNGSRCSYLIDGTGPTHPVACNTLGTPLTGADVGGVGAHILTLEVDDGPNGPYACNTAVELAQPQTTTCGLIASPPVGGTSTVFVLSAASNGSRCTYSVDGVNRGSLPCVGRLGLTGMSLGGIGNRRVELHVEEGPGGATKCSTLIPVGASLPSCAASVVPMAGPASTTFSLNMASDGDRCDWELDGVKQPQRPCIGLSTIAGIAAGVGVHQVLVTATGLSGVQTCGARFTVEPTCGLQTTSNVVNPTTEDFFTTTWKSDGSRCSYSLDGVEKGTVLCSSTNRYLGSVVGAGEHVYDLRAEGPGGTTTSCKSAFSVFPTCHLSSSFERGTRDQNITQVWASSGDRCEWSFDGANQGQLPCTSNSTAMGSVFGFGQHTLELRATGGAGRGLTSSCRSSFTIVPTCAIALSPTTGSLSANTPITVTWSSDGETCASGKDGFQPIVLSSCSGSLVVGAGFFETAGPNHLATLTTSAPGNGGPVTATCESNRIIIAP